MNTLVKYNKIAWKVTSDCLLLLEECVTDLVQTNAEGQTALSCGSRVVLIMGPLISCLCLALQVSAIKHPTICEVRTFIGFYGLTVFSSSYLFWKKKRTQDFAPVCRRHNDDATPTSSCTASNQRSIPNSPGICN